MKLSLTGLNALDGLNLKVLAMRWALHRPFMEQSSWAFHTVLLGFWGSPVCVLGEKVLSNAISETLFGGQA